MKCLFFVFLFTSSLPAQIETYTSTKDDSMSKYNRIGHIEEYLEKMSAQLKKMEAKIDKISNSSDQKEAEGLKSLERKVLSIQQSMEKSEQNFEQFKNGEFKDLQNQLKSLKGDDIKKLKNDLAGFQVTLESMQNVIEAYEIQQNSRNRSQSLPSGLVVPTSKDKKSP